jgi:hypothetical protein
MTKRSSNKSSKRGRTCNRPPENHARGCKKSAKKFLRPSKWQFRQAEKSRKVRVAEAFFAEKIVLMPIYLSSHPRSLIKH